MHVSVDNGSMTDGAWNRLQTSHDHQILILLLSAHHTTNIHFHPPPLLLLNLKSREANLQKPLGLPAFCVPLFVVGSPKSVKGLKGV